MFEQFFFFWLKLGFQLLLINAWNICASTQVLGIQCFRRVVEPSKAVCLLTWSLSDSCSSNLLHNYVASDIAMTSVCAEVFVATTSGSQVLANDPILGTYHKVFMSTSLCNGCCELGASSEKEAADFCDVCKKAHHTRLKAQIYSLQSWHKYSIWPWLCRHDQSIAWYKWCYASL